MIISKLRINTIDGKQHTFDMLLYTIDEARDDVVFANVEGTAEYVFPKDNIATIIRTGDKDDTPVINKIESAHYDNSDKSTIKL